MAVSTDKKIWDKPKPWQQLLHELQRKLLLMEIRLGDVERNQNMKALNEFPPSSNTGFTVTLQSKQQVNYVAPPSSANVSPDSTSSVNGEKKKEHIPENQQIKRGIQKIKGPRETTFTTAQPRSTTGHENHQQTKVNPKTQQNPPGKDPKAEELYELRQRLTVRNRYEVDTNMKNVEKPLLLTLTNEHGEWTHIKMSESTIRRLLQNLTKDNKLNIKVKMARGNPKLVLLYFKNSKDKTQIKSLRDIQLKDGRWIEITTQGERTFLELKRLQDELTWVELQRFHSPKRITEILAALGIKHPVFIGEHNRNRQTRAIQLNSIEEVQNLLTQKNQGHKTATLFKLSPGKTNRLTEIKRNERENNLRQDKLEEIIEANEKERQEQRKKRRPKPDEKREERNVIQSQRRPREDETPTRKHSRHLFQGQPPDPRKPRRDGQPSDKTHQRKAIKRNQNRLVQ